jgi:Zn-dependent protease/predicted transcriptional regulator
MAEQLAGRGRSGVFSLFKIAGIRISLDYSWFIVFALVIWSLSAGYFPRNFPGQTTQTYWIAGLIATLLFFASVLIHELSHSLMAMRSGIHIPEITLFLFGGVSKLSEEPRDPKTELKIAIVGPLSSFGLALLFWAMQKLFSGSGVSLTKAVLHYLAWINLALGIFNLIPGFPLDGGRILRALRWWKTGSLTQATKLASDVGKGFAVALMLLGGLQIFAGFLIGGLWLLFIGMFLRSVAEGGYQEVVVRQMLQGVQVDEVMVREVVSVAPDLPVNQLINGYFLHYGYKGFPVAQGGRVLGMVSVFNVKGLPEDEQKNKTVAQVMEPLSDDLLISPQVSLTEALRKTGQTEAGRLVVMQGGKMVGLISKTGLLRYLEMKRILEG